MAFDGGIESIVIDVNIFQHSGFVQPTSAFVGSFWILTTFFGTGGRGTCISSFGSLDTCRWRHWFHWRSFGGLLSVPFESQIDIGTDLFTVQGVKVMLVFYKNKRQNYVWSILYKKRAYHSKVLTPPEWWAESSTWNCLEPLLRVFLIIYTFCTLLCLSLRLHHQGVKGWRKKKKSTTKALLLRYSATRWWQVYQKV